MAGISRERFLDRLKWTSVGDFFSLVGLGLSLLFGSGVIGWLLVCLVVCSSLFVPGASGALLGFAACCFAAFLMVDVGSISVLPWVLDLEERWNWLADAPFACCGASGVAFQTLWDPFLACLGF